MPEPKPDSSRTVVPIRGRFDLDAARRLSAMIANSPPEQCFLLDFSQAELQDAALFSLLRALAVPPVRPVATLGLSRHHHRLLAYLA